MNKVWVFLFTALAGSNLMAKTLHVDLNSTNSIAPYSSRETAATDIQTAVNAAVEGDTVQVWDGHYLLASEITVSKAITVQSVNGPETTIVDGQGSVRCFNLGKSTCVVEGLTITNGFSTVYGGGIYCSDTTPVVTNCILSGNWAGASGGGMRSGTANHCTIRGNSAYYGGGGMYNGTANNCIVSGNSGNRGGGMYYGTAINCILSGNSAECGGGMMDGTANNCIISGNSGNRGGGMSDGTADNCTIYSNSSNGTGGGMFNVTASNCAITGNSAFSFGGGMYRGSAYNCTINGNSADEGGGIFQGTAINSAITGNSAFSYGGGMRSGTANNCTLNLNSAEKGGGGIYEGTANNCTLSGNWAWSGGGMARGTANNCIVWYNTSSSVEKDLSFTTARYSCSSGVTHHGSNGNITNAPVFVDAVNGDYRLAAGSPCIDAGSNAYVVGSLDLDSMPRIVGGLVDMGAYEYQGAGIVDQDSDGLPDDWETEHFGGTAGQGSGDDFDNDGIDNGSEWIAGTDPSDPNSMFVASVSTNQASSAGFLIEWTSVEDRTYSVLWGRTLTNANDVLQEGIEYPQNSYTDTVHGAESTGFYQIEVQLR